jgi:hypothetical protein
MDSHKRSTQLERLEVVEIGRRRRWSNDEKLRIVTESFAATPTGGQIVIVVGRDRRVIVDAGVDAAALARVLQVLEGR